MKTNENRSPFKESNSLEKKRTTSSLYTNQKISHMNFKQVETSSKFKESALKSKQSTQPQGPKQLPLDVMSFFMAIDIDRLKQENDRLLYKVKEFEDQCLDRKSYEVQIQHLQEQMEFSVSQENNYKNDIEHLLFTVDHLEAQLEAIQVKSKQEINQQQQTISSYESQLIQFEKELFASRQEKQIQEQVLTAQLIQQNLEMTSLSSAVKNSEVQLDDCKLLLNQLERDFSQKQNQNLILDTLLECSHQEIETLKIQQGTALGDYQELVRATQCETLNQNQIFSAKLIQKDTELTSLSTDLKYSDCQLDDCKLLLSQLEGNFINSQNQNQSLDILLGNSIQEVKTLKIQQVTILGDYQQLDQTFKLIEGENQALIVSLKNNLNKLQQERDNFAIQIEQQLERDSEQLKIIAPNHNLIYEQLQLSNDNLIQVKSLNIQIAQDMHDLQQQFNSQEVQLSTSLIRIASHQLMDEQQNQDQVNQLITISDQQIQIFSLLESNQNLSRLCEQKITEINQQQYQIHFHEITRNDLNVSFSELNRIHQDLLSKQIENTEQNRVQTDILNVNLQQSYYLNQDLEKVNIILDKKIETYKENTQTLINQISYLNLAIQNKNILISQQTEDSFSLGLQLKNSQTSQQISDLLITNLQQTNEDLTESQRKQSQTIAIQIILQDDSRVVTEETKKMNEEMIIELSACKSHTQQLEIELLLAQQNVIQVVGQQNKVEYHQYYKNAILSDQIVNLQGKVDMHLKQLSELRHSITQSNQREQESLATQEAQNILVQQDLQATKLQVLRKSEKNTLSTKEIRSLNTELDKLQEQAEDYESQNEKQKRDIKNLQREVSIKENQCIIINERVIQLENEILNLDSLIDAKLLQQTDANVRCDNTVSSQERDSEMESILMQLQQMKSERDQIAFTHRDLICKMSQKEIFESASVEFEQRAMILSSELEQSQLSQQNLRGEFEQLEMMRDELIQKLQCSQKQLEDYQIQGEEREQQILQCQEIRLKNIELETHNTMLSGEVDRLTTNIRTKIYELEQFKIGHYQLEQEFVQIPTEYKSVHHQLSELDRLFDVNAGLENQIKSLNDNLVHHKLIHSEQSESLTVALTKYEDVRQKLFLIEEEELKIQNEKMEKARQEIEQYEKIQQQKKDQLNQVQRKVQIQRSYLM